MKPLALKGLEYITEDELIIISQALEEYRKQKHIKELQENVYTEACELITKYSKDLDFSVIKHQIRKALSDYDKTKENVFNF